MKPIRRVLAFLCSVVIALALSFNLARADEKVADRLDVEAQLAADGTLKVAQTLTFSGGVPATVTQRLATQRDTLDKAYYSYTYADISATAEGTDLGASVAQDGAFTVVTVPTGNANVKPITIS